MKRTDGNTRCNSRQNGISLIELMIVIAILAIMAAFALPGIESSVNTGHRAAGLAGAMGMVDGARSNAISRRLPISVCPSSDQQSCNSDNWADGWVMFIDDGASGTARDGKRSSREKIIQTGQAAVASITIRSHEFSAGVALVFDELGMIADSGSLVVCDKNSTAATVLVVSQIGQSLRENPADIACS